MYAMLPRPPVLASHSGVGIDREGNAFTADARASLQLCAFPAVRKGMTPAMTHGRLGCESDEGLPSPRNNRQMVSARGRP